MAQTPPIPAGQPLDAPRTAAGQALTLAGAQAVAVQAAASITLAALLWPLIPAARAAAGPSQRAGPAAPAAPLPEQQVAAVMPGPGVQDGPRHCPAGPPGAVRAAGAITLGVEEKFVLLDPSTGAAVPAGPDLVRMLGGEPEVRQELMRFQVETATRVHRPFRSPRPWPPRPGTGSPGRNRPGHRAGRRCGGAPRPPPRSCRPRAQRPR